MNWNAKTLALVGLAFVGAAYVIHKRMFVFQVGATERPGPLPLYVGDMSASCLCVRRPITSGLI